MYRTRLRLSCATGALLALAASNVHALSFEFDDAGEISGVLNTTMTAGAGWRMEKQSAELIGKANLNPDVCTRQYQSCQGLFRGQTYPTEHLASAPGAASMRADDGDLNYNEGDIFQAPFKITQDFTVTYGDFGLFAKWLYFYDFINNDFTETHPNLITPDNVNQVGFTDDPVANRYWTNGLRTYGPGARVRSQRTDGETLRQAGTNLQLLDANIYGRLPFLGERELSFKIGRQTVNWGESTLLAVNSVNQANPVNANNLYRVGFQVEEIFTPVGMVFLSSEPFYGATIEAYYQYEWAPLEAPTPGTYFGFADLGTNNLGNSVNLSFGASPDDPDRAFVAELPRDQIGYLDNPLTLITPTSGTLTRLKDWEPSDQGQYGLAFKYYAEELNNGTEFGLYYMNYHSKLPYISFFSAQASCARREGNSLGLDARNTSEYLRACPNLPVLANTAASGQLLQDALVLGLQRPGILADLGTDLVGLLSLLGGNPDEPYSNAVQLDGPMLVFEYPENLHMFGASFNTTLGEYSIQGEVAYRPNAPLQVAITDLAFAALGPTLSRCHDASIGCFGTTAGSGFDENGDRTIYGSSDFVDANGNNPYTDTINLLVGHVPGSARSFPSFIVPYRGGTVGENAPTDLSQPLNSKNPGYIRGYEEFDTYQFNFGFTRVLGATDQPFGADQIQLVGEFGATWVPGLPALDQLQIESPGVFYHASAGADGSGADGSQQACSTNPSCSVGGDGLRFNPHQADLDAFVDKLSWGYRLIAIVKYEGIWGPISMQPFIVWAQDVSGTAPGPGENFVEGRKQALLNIETRYRSALSLTLGYGWFVGGGENNLYSDRDFAQAFVKYQF
ncbi:DUF1302 domain-containing protein [Sinimarinibacterium sp. CAU 1509]|uniref:DUF1302 domain-containing protein n=1 Tax=Sinimarinibacterium sp. CAU 1509 TaxID=2562283 RepID=UPI0010ABF227|nr:DUF1302 family protein [Sinimarinibacterium sp. CAU 1509]TJY65065.1 DUF1302 domain-containing protein [Sinimarinibacterium sp. CAU 1509]